jgi:hypothetical protein
MVKTWRFGEAYCMYLRRRNVIWRPSLTCSVMDDGWHRHGTVVTLKTEARVSCVALVCFCYQATRLINPDDSQLYFTAFLPLGILPAFLFSFSFFFVYSLSLLLIRHFPLRLFLTCGPSVGTAFIFFHPGVCNTTTTWQSHSIFTDCSRNTKFRVTKLTSPSHIVKDLRFYY